MKFKFPYTPLLNHRKRQQDLAMKIYADALSQLNKEKQKLSDFYDQTSNAIQFRFDQETQGGPIDILRSVDTFTKGQQIRIDNQRKVVMRHQQIVEEKFELLRKASVAFKIIERLEEKKKEEFKLEKRQRDLKEMDEITTMRASRRNRDQ